MGRKKNVLFLIIILTILVFCIWFFVIRDKEIELEVPAISLEEIEYNIDSSNKEIKISLSNNELRGKLFTLSKSWDQLFGQYKNQAPEIYKKTRDWDKKVWEIRELTAKSYELSLEDKEDEARAEAEKARNIYLEIKKENNILDISTELYAFYNQADLISKAKNKNEINVLLPKLKIQFAGIKERKQDKSYLNAISRIEELIVRLDRQMNGPELQLAQKDLIIITKKIYLNN